MKVLALTQGKNIPSARFRINNLVPYLSEAGIDVDIVCPSLSSYPPSGSARKRVYWLGITLLEQLINAVFALINQRKYDCIILQRELISTLATFEVILPRPIVFDIDDAIWLSGSGKAFLNGISTASHVVTSTKEIANYAVRFHKNVTVIPTSVETSVYYPGVRDASVIRIGWTGTSSGYNLFPGFIWAMLSQATRSDPRVIPTFHSDKPPPADLIDKQDYEFISWNTENERQAISSFDIGIMPLVDSEWARYKASYKMLLYMSCGVPYVVSPVGNNVTIGELGGGFLANTRKDWDDCLLSLIKNSTLRSELGKRGRAVVESRYSCAEMATQWVSILRSLG